MTNQIKKIFLLLLTTSLFSMTFAQKEAKWLRYPAISPDGSTIIFGYMGNLYRVNSKGGLAIPITVGDDYNTNPVWSHDGKTIAFSSNHYGNFDVYTMPATGGTPIRLTYNSANDYPYDFTPDNKEVLFGSGREAPAKSVRFPGTRYWRVLYTIPATGGRPIMVTASGADAAHYNSDGSEIIFQDKKGYEDPWRKHEISPVTRDIWTYNVKQNAYKKLTKFGGNDLSPVFSKDDRSVYYISEKNDGTLNIYKRLLATGNAQQISHFKNFPARELTSISNDNIIAYTWKGEIYTQKDGGSPVKIKVQIMNDAGYQAIKNIPINSVEEFAVSPDGKEIAFVNRGEIFVTGVNDSLTKRITNTPYQERMISWSPKGDYLMYSAEKNGSWSIYQKSLKYPKEKYFYASTVLKTEPVVEKSSDDFQAEYSPDGKKIAYVNERNVLKVMDVKSNKTFTVLPKGRNHSYADGDWGFDWSPDSKWLLVDDEKEYMSSLNTALIKADGSGKAFFPINSGFGENNPKWAMEGKMMTYLNSRDGLKSLANHGQAQEDIFAVFFDQKAYDRYRLSNEDYELLKEKEKDEKKAKESSKKGSKKGKKKGKKSKKQKDADKAEKDLKLNLKNLDFRIVKLTINSSPISGYVLNKDASKVFYMSKGEKGYNLWVTEPRTRKTKILAKLSGSPSSIEISKDSTSLFLTNRGRLVKVDANNGEIKNVSFSATMALNTAAERKYIFDHAWKQVIKKFYDPNIHGINWKMYHDEYAKFLPYINNNYDFQVLLSELLGELNASHTGARYYNSTTHSNRTASLGLLYDQTYNGPGIKISEVINGGPLDNAESKVKAGDIITAINGQNIKATDNWNKYLNNISYKNTLLTIKAGKKSFTQNVRPVSMRTESRLMYKRWTDKMANMVDSLSHGQLGYVHIKGMNDRSFRHVYANVLGKNLDKKALVVDTRFNGGGWLHDDLNTFLSGKLYMKLSPQGNILKGGESMTRWYKPSAVLISEGNYSDAFLFPFIYKQNKIGKLIGMPVAGTGTAVWWETQIDPSIIFGIPMVATMGYDGKVTEGRTLYPDIQVKLPYNDFLQGKDPQLKTAVDELLKGVNKQLSTNQTLDSVVK